jgi:hypothetical protein
MRNFTVLAFVASSMLLVGGCNTVDQTQVQIAPAEPGGTFRAIVPPADREAIKAVLKPVADQFKMQDLTDLAISPKIIAYYQQVEKDMPLKLMAWNNDTSIVIDLLQGPSIQAPTTAYLDARERLLQDLQRAFGNRATLVPFSKVINAPGEK